jgi:hypothetical protein
MLTALAPKKAVEITHSADQRISLILVETPFSMGMCP